VQRSLLFVDVGIVEFSCGIKVDSSSSNDVEVPNDSVIDNVDPDDDKFVDIDADVSAGVEFDDNELLIALTDEFVKLFSVLLRVSPDVLFFEVTVSITVWVDEVEFESIVLIIDEDIDGDVTDNDDDKLETDDWELDRNDASDDDKLFDKECCVVNRVLEVVVVVNVVEGVEEAGLILVVFVVIVIVVVVVVVVIVVVVVVVVVGFDINLLVKYTDEQLPIEFCFKAQHLCCLDGLKFI
jgi:hypothetical protein